MKGKRARRALWLWIAFLGLIILALTATPFFVSGLLEPGYQAFRRDIAREMRYVKPLPAGLTIVEEWEDCGQGADPMCSGVVLLVDDDLAADAPIGRVRAALTENGWIETADEPAVFERTRAERSGARIELQPADKVDPSMTFDPDRYRNPSLDELAYIYVAP